MKRKSLISLLTMLVFSGTMFFFTSCGEEDTEAPVITLNEPDNNYTVFGTEYTDPGATATDNEDGDIEVTASGTVDEKSAGEHIITYTATDEAGNSTTEDRIVTVDAGAFLGGINYEVTDPTWSTYTDRIDASSANYNKIVFNKYADYEDAVVTGTCEGTNITIAEQVIENTGTDQKTRTFSGNGTFTEGRILTINYSVVENNDVIAEGTATYTPL